MCKPEKHRKYTFEPDIYHTPSSLEYANCRKRPGGGEGSNSSTNVDSAAHTSRVDTVAHIDSVDTAAHIESVDTAAHIDSVDIAALIDSVDIAALIESVNTAAHPPDSLSMKTGVGWGRANGLPGRNQ